LPTTLHYTTSGYDPTGSDATVPCNGQLPITQSETLKVSGWRTGAPTSVVAAAAYELVVTTPTTSLASGLYASPQTVTLSTTTPGATITYTVDGSDPTAGSTAYTGPLTINSPTTLKFRGVKANWTNSDVAYATYWVDAGTVATPTISLGLYALPGERTILMADTTSGSTIRYTLDGRDP